MTADPTERAALARAAARLSTASKAREADSPGVAQPETVRSDTGTPESEHKTEELRDVDAQEKAQLGDGTAR